MTARGCTVRIVAVIVGLCAWTCLWACRTPAETPLADEPEGATAITIQTPDSWWKQQGFVRLTPPIRLPGPTSGRLQTSVWLRIPDGGTIQTRWLASQGRYTIELPPGTIADRVDTWTPGEGDRVARTADVRGGRLEADGAQTFRLLRPESHEAGAALFGYEWPRGQRAVTQAVHERIAEEMVQGRGFAWKTTKASRERGISGFHKRSGCAGCHPSDRARRLQVSDPGIVSRPTDTAGYYVPLSVLSDQAPVETYHPRDNNAEDPCVSVTCGDVVATLESSETGARRFRCKDASVPIARLDVPCGLRSEDAHTAAVCASRRYLYEHMDDVGKGAFADAFVACNIGTPLPSNATETP